MMQSIRQACTYFCTCTGGEVELYHCSKYTWTNETHYMAHAAVTEAMHENKYACKYISYTWKLPKFLVTVLWFKSCFVIRWSGNFIYISRSSTLFWNSQHLPWPIAIHIRYVRKQIYTSGFVFYGNVIILRDPKWFVCFMFRKTIKYKYPFYQC